MKKKIRRIGGVTVRKLHRLARELEALNGVRVSWSCYPYYGRTTLTFDLKTRDPKKQNFTYFTGVAFTVQQALNNFYETLGGILINEKLDPECREEGLIKRHELLPSRFSAISAERTPGLIGRHVVFPETSRA